MIENHMVKPFADDDAGTLCEICLENEAEAHQDFICWECRQERIRESGDALLDQREKDSLISVLKDITRSLAKNPLCRKQAQ